MTSYSVLALLPIVIVLFSIAGVVLIALGVRGRPVFSSPRCAKCGYDLRNMQFMSSEAVGNCPECGVHLADPGAVSFGRWQRQPKRMVWGVVLLILPWVAGAGLAAYARTRAVTRTAAAGGFVTPQQRAQMTTAALLANLKKTASTEPWDWQELEARLKRGALARADVDAAFGVLAADIAAKRAQSGRREPLHWGDGFIKSAIAGGNVTPQQVVALAQAFYSVDPKLTLRSRAREGETIPLTLNQYESWNLPGMKQVWSLASITADGSTPLVPQKRYPGGRRGEPPPPMHPDETSGYGNDGEMQLVLPHALPPGEHEITVTRVVGVIDDGATLRGLDGKPGVPAKWPSPVATWRSVVKKRVTVVPKGASVLALVTDANANPFASGGIVVEQALTRPSSRGVEFALKFKPTGKLTPLLSYHIWIRAGERKIDYGTLVMGTDPLGASSYHSYTASKIVKELAPEIRTIDLLFEVDEKAAEHYPSIEQIWGKPHAINGVKLERFDLPADANGDAPATQPR